MLWQRKMWAVMEDGHLLDQNGQALTPSGLLFLARTKNHAKNHAKIWRRVRDLVRDLPGAKLVLVRVLVTVDEP